MVLVVVGVNLVGFGLASAIVRSVREGRDPGTWLGDVMSCGCGLLLGALPLAVLTAIGADRTASLAAVVVAGATLFGGSIVVSKLLAPDQRSFRQGVSLLALWASLGLVYAAFVPS
jgi:hypothetical protein